MRILAIVAALLCASCDRLQSLATPPQTYDGAYLIIEVDQVAATTEHLEQLSDQAADVLRAAGIRFTGRGVADNVLRLRLERAAQLAAATQALAPITGHLVVTTLPEGVIELRLNETYLQTIAASAAEGAIEIIQRRVGTIARVEPYGPGRLVVRTSTSQIPEQVLRAVGERGQLTFHLVHDRPDRRVPIGAMISPPYLEGASSEIVNERPTLVGHIADARPTADAAGQLAVSFTLDADGARAFCRLTTENTGKRFAVLLDGRVVTAPIIREPICGGSGQISGNFTAETVEELAAFLRAGELPLPFTLVAQGAGVPSPITP